MREEGVGLAVEADHLTQIVCVHVDGVLVRMPSGLTVRKRAEKSVLQYR